MNPIHIVVAAPLLLGGCTATSMMNDAASYDDAANPSLGAAALKPLTHGHCPKAGFACSDIRGAVKERGLAQRLAVVEEGTDAVDDGSANGVVADQNRHAETEIAAALRLDGLFDAAVLFGHIVVIVTVGHHG